MTVKNFSQARLAQFKYRLATLLLVHTAAVVQSKTALLVIASTVGKGYSVI